MTLRFDNLFCRELPADPEQENFVREVRSALWSAVRPAISPAPQVIAVSAEMAAELGVHVDELWTAPWANALVGNQLLPGMATYATCYGGHQFGHWAGQLGDGRAIMLGEAVNAANQRWELQLKGAGKTPYARGADGCAVLRSSLREFLCSEAMHHLGIPTTRALSLALTGEHVLRDMFYDGHATFEPGAIVCRAAPSFTRFGHFELLNAREDLGLLQQLAEFTLARDFPSIDPKSATRFADWYIDICRRTALMVAHWMRVGFVHGVMNTDNMSILGLTIDYGPYGWLENFDPMWTPNTTDAHGRRYCYSRQPDIAGWNLQCLGFALSPLFNKDSKATITTGLEIFRDTYQYNFQHHFAAKLGLTHWQNEDTPLLQDLLHWMQRAQIDFTDFFRRLAALPLNASTESLIKNIGHASYDHSAFLAEMQLLQDWLSRYRQRINGDNEDSDFHARQQRMDAVNPRFVLRNYLAQEAIDLATAGDYQRISALLDVMRHPYAEQAQHQHFAEKRPAWAQVKPGCSMLSCSS